jgi:hypothetical protein
MTATAPEASGRRTTRTSKVVAVATAVATAEPEVEASTTRRTRATRLSCVEPAAVSVEDAALRRGRSRRLTEPIGNVRAAEEETTVAVEDSAKARSARGSKRVLLRERCVARGTYGCIPCPRLL